MTKEPSLIASFQVDHDILVPGLYVSRIDGDAVTYDLRMKTPNNKDDDYLTPKVLHTLEHLLATALRFSKDAASVIYAGPMGCRTGFYIVLRDALSRAEALALVKQGLSYAASFSGEIPGAKRKECGNYREHDLAGAKREAQAMLSVLANWTIERMDYPQGEKQ